MKKVITLTENDLNHIIREVLNEQFYSYNLQQPQGNSFYQQAFGGKGPLGFNNPMPFGNSGSNGNQSQGPYGFSFGGNSSNGSQPQGNDFYQKAFAGKVPTGSPQFSYQQAFGGKGPNQGNNQQQNQGNNQQQNQGNNQQKNQGNNQQQTQGNNQQQNQGNNQQQKNNFGAQPNRIYYQMKELYDLAEKYGLMQIALHIKKQMNGFKPNNLN